MAHADAGRYALYGGLVSYLCGHLLFRLRNVGSINPARATAAVVLLVLIPLLGDLDPVAQIALPAAILISLGRVRDLRLPRRAPRDPHVHVVIPAGAGIGGWRSRSGEARLRYDRDALPSRITRAGREPSPTLATMSPPTMNAMLTNPNSRPHTSTETSVNP